MVETGSVTSESALHAADVRNQREETRALHGARELALMPRARSAEPRGKNLAVIRDEASERAVILVVDEVHTRLAERTRFGGSSHVHGHFLFLVVVIVLIATRVGGRELLFGEFGRAELTIVQRQEVANETVVEAQGALVLR